MNDSGPRRVAVTGVGLLTSVGSGRDAVWRSLLEGRSGIGRIRAYEPTAFRTQIGAEVADIEVVAWLAERQLGPGSSRGDRIGMAGAVLAIADAGWDVGSAQSARAGLFVGGHQDRAVVEPAGSAAPPALMAGLAAMFGLRGTSVYFHGTADAGATAIGGAFRAIRRGHTDVALAGGFDDATSAASMSRLDVLGVLSGANDLGPRAFRPYDARRTGSVLGDGAAFLVLEELGAARRRGARVYAEVAGFGSTYDGDRLLTPEPSGDALAVAATRALVEARVDAIDVGYVAAHGCATRLGDVSEARALSTVFGPHVRPPVSSVKPATGHLVAAAGALNAAVAVLTIASGLAPPTLNLEEPDPDCPMNAIPHEARSVHARHALAVARGLHGQQVVLVLSAVV